MKKSLRPRGKKTRIHSARAVRRNHNARRSRAAAAGRAASFRNGVSTIVCIGASAGGFESVTQLFKQLSPDTGMTFVLVQHLDPAHESMMASLLSGVTKMKVAEARSNEPLLPNRCYVIPPNKLMELSDMKLKLLPRKSSAGGHMPIDWFMSSLADAVGRRAIGIVLSGTGTDGTRGLLAIKAAGGITFAESQRSARYAGMPASAVAAGCVDFVLTPEKIAQELKPLAAHPRLSIVEEGEEAERTRARQPGFEAILAQLRQRQGVDFSHYKPATLRRRIHRRMVINKLDSLKDYASYLRGHPAEVKELFNDILIHVTGFFRDPMVFQTLRKKLLPRLLRNKPAEQAVRIWIPGCSTGEEVYSVAILLMEFMSTRNVRHPVQIFGTDINEIALARARAGLYGESAISDISAERLRRYFLKTDGGYRVNKMIREMCIFARQNLVNDPPFSNLDLISCRNVLIYLGPELQRKVMPVFHYALRDDGMLMLGASETIGGFASLFSLLDPKAKVYLKRSVRVRPAVNFAHEVVEPPIPQAHPVLPPAGPLPTISDVQKLADGIILKNYTLPGVVINKQLEVVQFRGRTGPFLEHGHGEASLNLLKMARDGLGLELRAAVMKAIKHNKRTRQEGVSVRQNGHTFECNFEIVPFSPSSATERFYLVMFETVTPRENPGTKDKARKVAEPRARESAELLHLRESLAATQESLQAIIEEQEATNEELRSANEEVMSSNEELQSTNEELETAKEELQSSNEELTTLNDELESRNTELEQVNNDLHNLLASVNIPLLILDAELRIRRFTGLAEKMFKLIPTDIGRPVTDINLPLDIPSLEKVVLEVFDTLVPSEVELQDKEGHWWSMRIRPYKTAERKIDGAVLALVDIDQIKRTMQNVVRARDMAEAVVKTVREPLVVLDPKLNLISANPAFYRLFKVGPQETIGERLHDLGNRQWDIAPLRKLLTDVLLRHNSFENFMVEQEFPRIGRKKMMLNGRVLEHETDKLILLAIEEVPT